MSRLLACLVLIAFVGPSAACINDIELPSHEREFRSQYRGPNVSRPISSEPANSPSSLLLYGSGATLFAGALALTGCRTKR